MNEEQHPQTHVLPAGLFLALAGIAIAGLAWFGVQHSRATLEADKRDTGADIMKAVRLGQGGDYAAAGTILAQVVKKHPDNVDALFNLGIARAGQENYEEAEQLFLRVNKINPTDYEAVAERAAIREMIGDGDGAVALLETIPVGAGNLSSRLTQDPRWNSLKDDPKMKVLMKKHGIVEATTTSTPAAP